MQSVVAFYWCRFLVRLKGFQKLTSIDEALHMFFKHFDAGPLKKANVPLVEALNRILAEDMVAEQDLPRFDRSAVDGYAIIAEDTSGASQFKPKILGLAEKDELTEGQARQVWTGNPVPKGADAVVMLEDCKRLDGKVEVWVSVTPGENVSRKGEDISQGEIAVKAGTRLKPQHLGLLAALEINEVKVFEKPTIAILATGNELVETGNRLKESQVFEVNRLILSAMCRELGAEPLDLGIAKDNVEEIVEKMEFGLGKADAILTTGGTSVGAADLVPEAINKMGKPGVIVHGIAMRPAMPTALAVVREKPVIILSGNPVAAMIGFEVFARPLISKMLGLKQMEQRPIVQGKITRRVTTTLGRRAFVRVNVFQKNGEFFADPVSVRGSGMISTMTGANGYVVVPENREGLDKGELVIVHLFDNITKR